MKSLKYLVGLGVCFVILTIGCSFSTQNKSSYKLNDPELIPFSTIYSIEREKYCLTEINPDSIVEIEQNIYATSGYHTTLHIYYRNVSRTISFIREKDEYIWVSEQEIHRSGRTFETSDGKSRESISITYNKNRDNGTSNSSIIYNGDKEKGIFSGLRFDLTCDEVRPYIEAWDKKTQEQ